MGRFNSKAVTPKFSAAGGLPEGEYRVRLTDVGSWNSGAGEFQTGLITATSNKNPQFILNWQIVGGDSHVNLFIRDFWQITENAFPYILGKLDVITAGQYGEFDADTSSQAAKAIMAIIKDEIGTEISVWAGTATNNKTGRKSNVIKRYIKLNL